MNTQRLIGALLIILQGYLLTTLTWATPFFITSSLIALLGVWVAIPLPAFLFVLLAGTAAASFTLANVLSPPWIANDWILEGRYVVAATQTLIVIQILELLKTRLSLRLSPRFSALVLVGFLVGFCRLETEANSFQFFLIATIMAVLFALLSQANFRSDQSLQTRYTKNSPFRFVVFASAAIGIFLGAGYLSNTAKSITGVFRYFVTGKVIDSIADISTTQVAYTASGKLDMVTNLKQTSPDTVVLESTCDVQPGYLRGRVFSQFVENQWKDPDRSQFELSPTRNRTEYFGKAGLQQLEVERNAKVFPLIEDNEGPFRLVVTRNRPTLVGKVVFTPHETDLIACNTRRVFLDEHKVVRGGVSIRNDYFTAVSKKRPRSRLSPRLRQELLQVPDVTRAKLASIAEEVVQNCNSDEERMKQIEFFFQTKFEYSLSTTAKEGDDLVSEFVLEQRKGHCEYFASAADMLLRLNGIPCRYVTGFTMVEPLQSDTNSGEEWIARNKHAHAWVEAFDREKEEWTIVEPTPGMSVPKTIWPEGSLSQRTSQSLDDNAAITERSWLSRKFLWLRRFVSAFGIQLTSTINLVLACSLPVLFYFYYRARKQRFLTTYSIRSFRRKLRKLDDRLRHFDLVRGPSETLHQFAKRLLDYVDQNPAREDRDWIRSAARDYIEYAKELYGNPQRLEAN